MRGLIAAALLYIAIALFAAGARAAVTATPIIPNCSGVVVGNANTPITCLGLSLANGIQLQGAGGTYDVSILNKNGAVALGVQTGTANIVLGTVTAPNPLFINGSPGIGSADFYGQHYVGGTCNGNCGAFWLDYNMQIASTKNSAALYVTATCCGQNGLGVAGYSAPLVSLSEVGTTVTATFPNPFPTAVIGETAAISGSPGAAYDGSYTLTGAVTGASNTTVTFTAAPNLVACLSACGTIATSFISPISGMSVNETIAFDPLVRTGNGAFYTGLIEVGHSEVNVGGWSASVGSISEASGSTATLTIATPTPVPAPTEIFYLSGSTPSGYNGVPWTAATVSNVGGTSTITFNTVTNIGNGTGGTATAYLGKQVGFNTYAEIDSAATYWSGLTGYELDLYVGSGAHLYGAAGMLVVLQATNQSAPDAVQFSAYTVAAANTALPTITCAYCLGNVNAGNALASTASIMQWIPEQGASQTAGPSIANGFYFPNLTFSGLAYDTPGATIDGSGNAVLNTLKLAAIPSSAGGGGKYVCADSTGATYEKASCP